MSRFNYSRLKNTASRMLDRFGRDVHLVAITTTGPGYDPTVTETKRDAVFLDDTDNQRYRMDSVIQFGDMVGYMQADAAPKLSEKFEDDDGSRYSIVSVEPIRTGPMALMYKIHVRR